MSINKAAVPGLGQMLQKTMGRIKFVTQGMNATAQPRELQWDRNPVPVSLWKVGMPGKIHMD